MKLKIRKMTNKLIYYYRLLFFQACAGKNEKHKDVKELAHSAYWLISAMQGVNLVSLIFIICALLNEKINKIALSIFFIFPLFLNYSYFLKNYRYKFILNEFSKRNHQKKGLQSFGLIISYFFLTIFLFYLSGILYRKI